MSTMAAEDQDDNTCTNAAPPPPCSKDDGMEGGGDETKRNVSFADVDDVDVVDDRRDDERGSGVEQEESQSSSTHYLVSGGSTSNSNFEQPLDLKFSEEGSSTAAVRDENCEKLISSARDATTTGGTCRQDPSSVQQEQAQQVHHNISLDNIGKERPPISVSGTNEPVVAGQQHCGVGEAVKAKEEEPTATTTTTMGTKVTNSGSDGADSNCVDNEESVACSPLSILQDALDQEEQPTTKATTTTTTTTTTPTRSVADLKEFTDEDAVEHGVLVSPSIGDNLIDQVCLSRDSFFASGNDGDNNNNNSSTIHVDDNNNNNDMTQNMLMMTPTLSYEEAGIILPPSMKGLRGIKTSNNSVSSSGSTCPTTPTLSPFSTTSLNISNSNDNDNGNNDNITSPPSMSTPTTISTPTTSHHPYHPSATSASQLMSLPIDSLHCVASFLTALEWSQYGQTCIAASKICREIFRRVRMHGFRCATEIISAWKLDQQADARELASLYISSGVPIYPFAMGHSYHTVCWRMGVEAKSMQEKAAAEANASTAAADNNNNNNNNNNRPADQSTEAGDEDDNAYAVDRFYNERHNGTRGDGSHVMCSYLEDKCMYMVSQTPQGNLAVAAATAAAAAANPFSAGVGGGGRFHSMTALSTLQRDQLAAATGQQQPLLPPSPAAGTAWSSMMNLSPLSTSSSASSPARSVSQSDMLLSRRNSMGGSGGGSSSRTTAPKVMVQIHRHLLDQHLLGRSCVDDENGDMKTPPINLSADFFHPHLCVHSISSHSRPLMPTTATTATANNNNMNNTPVRAASAGVGGPDGHLLEDPAFQAWAARAAATVHNRLGGAGGALDDAEGLVDLQELYSQIFAGDGNQAPLPPPPPPPAAAVMGDLDNALRHATAAGGGPPPPIPPPVPVGAMNPVTSLDDLSPRHGYSSILNSVDFEVYSASSANAKDNKSSDIKRQLRTRFTFYQRRLEVLLSHGDSSGYEECMLDFWDEFFPLTSKIHYYDQHTAVPRISCLQQFLTQPCPKEVGIVQCEIERVKISSKKRKGVSMKGRLFPTYEYRLFIKDRQHGKSTNDTEHPLEEDNGARRDTVLMIAKNRGRKHVDTSGVISLTPAAKKGANNYYLYTPQQADVDTHYNAINETEKEETGNNNGCSLSAPAPGTAPPMLLGRLQSNFIGTEFQIYTPKLRKSLPGRRLRRCASLNESPCSFDEDVDYDSGAASDTGSGRRKSRFGRLTLRRNSTTSSTVSERALSPVSSRSRSSNRTEMSSVRTPRMNRRAIANSVEDSPDAEADSCTNQQPFLCEEEDGVITYTANLLGSRPRIMDVCIPKISSDGQAGGVWRNYLENNEEPDDCAPYNRMLNCFKQLQQRLESQNANENGERPNDDNAGQRDDFGLLALQNRPPWWNIELGSFVLNFRGRVSVASVKNFQLCDRNDHDHIMLQFGRIQGRHSFTMDYQYPLTAVQAFSIAISSLQSKISFG